MYAYIDKQGEPICAFAFEDAYDFVDGRARVMQGGQWFFLDESGRRVGQAWDYAFDYSGGMAQVWRDGAGYFVDKTGAVAFAVEP